jgi:plastin-3
MRAYTLSVLSQLVNTGSATVDKEIVGWVNKKLQSAGKESAIKSFQDSSISNARVVLDLIDAIKPGSINYELIVEGNEYEVNLKILWLKISKKLHFSYFRTSTQTQSMLFRWREK